LNQETSKEKLIQ